MSVVRVYSLLDSVNPLMSFFGDSGEHETILRLLDGWLGSPDGTVDLSPLGRGNGAHDVPASDISYGERVVAVDYRILTQSRSRLLGLNARIRGFAGRPVRIRVTDDESDLFATGFLQEMSVDKTRQNMAMQTSTGTLTFVCPRPELLGWEPHRMQLYASQVKPGGLSFGDASNGLVFPLRFTESVGDEASTSVSNTGSFDASPVITVVGPFPDGILIQHDQGALEWTGSIGSSPLVLDCSPRAHTAVLGGVDVSRNLKRRDFPVVPAGGSLSLRVMSAGGGWIDVESRDTYL